MKKNIFLLAFCSFLLSQDNSTSGKWYIGISREGGDSFVLGNSESGWRYAISYDYNKDRDLYEEYTHSDPDNSSYIINPDIENSSFLYTLDIRKNLSGQNFSIFEKLPSGVTKKGEKYQRNLSLGVRSNYFMSKSEFENVNPSDPSQFFKYHNQSLIYSVNPYVGYTIEIFLKNNFSINLFAHISMNCEYREDHYETAYYEENNMQYLTTSLTKSQDSGSSNTGFEWSINYYFDE